MPNIISMKFLSEHLLVTGTNVIINIDNVPCSLHINDTCELDEEFPDADYRFITGYYLQGKKRQSITGVLHWKSGIGLAYAGSFDLTPKVLELARKIVVPASTSTMTA